MAFYRMKDWSITYMGTDFTAPELREYKLQGNVYGNPRFCDGTFEGNSDIDDWFPTYDLAMEALTTQLNKKGV